MDWKIADLILDWIAQDLVISESIVKAKWQNVDDDVKIRFEETLSSLIENGDIYFKNNNFSIAPATLTKTNDNFYKLLGHPHAEYILLEYGDIIKKQKIRVFHLKTSDMNFIEEMKRWGVWITK